MVLSEARRHAVLIDIMFPNLLYFFTICLQVYSLPTWRIFSNQAFGTQVKGKRSWPSDKRTDTIFRGCGVRAARCVSRNHLMHKKCVLLQNWGVGWGGAGPPLEGMWVGGNSGPNTHFKKAIFQGANSTIIGHPKHVLHLVRSPIGIAKAFLMY